MLGPAGSGARTSCPREAAGRSVGEWRGKYLQSFVGATNYFCDNLHVKSVIIMTLFF